MSELRKDYFLDRWVVISSGRGKRPQEFMQDFENKPPKTDFFAPGNEHLTPPEIGRIGGKNWKLRWFENKFPILSGHAPCCYHDPFFTRCHASGHHEILVETPDNRQLSDLSVNELKMVMDVYVKRISDLNRKYKYVSVFKNHGPKAGTSILHSHSQIIALEVIPPIIKEKVCAVRKFVVCPYQKIIEDESNSPRFCFENDSIIAFCPYASRFNFEVWIIPKNYVTSWSDINTQDFAKILKQVLEKLGNLNVSYNFCLYYSPNDDMRVHLELYPQIATWGGFERGTGIIVNSVPPEQAAGFYRGDE